MRARTKAAAYNLTVIKHITLIRLDPIKRNRRPLARDERRSRSGIGNYM
jgi:hypothetical protein